jgi:hypothetical protein
MKEPVHPTLKDIEELVSYLPKFSEPDFKPVEKWDELETTEGGYKTFPYPVYNQSVEQFFRTASKDCWKDGKYLTNKADELVEDDETIRKANISQIKSMLTFGVRGERFGVGHWAAMIELGKVTKILMRLKTLKENGVFDREGK